MSFGLYIIIYNPKLISFDQPKLISLESLYHLNHIMTGKMSCHKFDYFA